MALYVTGSGWMLDGLQFSVTLMAFCSAKLANRAMLDVKRSLWFVSLANADPGTDDEGSWLRSWWE